MVKLFKLLLICFGTILLSVSCSTPESKKVFTNGPEVVPFAALPFSLTDVKLLDGPFLDSLKVRKDVLPGKHANTNIPKLIALSRTFELTGDTSARTAAKFFWDRVVNHHSYVTGGNGDNEYFGPADNNSKNSLSGGAGISH